MKIFTLTVTILLLLVSGNCALAADNLATTQNITTTQNLITTKIFVHDINDYPIREATVTLVPINGGSIGHLLTNRKGIATGQVKPEIYDLSIEARNYRNVSKTITIFDENSGNIELTLVPDTGYDLWIFFLPVYLGFLLYMCWLCESSEKMKLAFVVFLLSMFIPLLVLMSDTQISESGSQMPDLNYTKLFSNPDHTIFSYISLFFSILLLITFILICLHFIQKRETTQKLTNFSSIIAEIFESIKAFLTILAILSWALIVCYFECRDVETVVISDLSFLEFPVYIAVGVTIGVLSYLMLTIRKTFSQLLPAHEKRNILWECTRRILIAPYIAVVGVYLISSISIGGIVDSTSNTAGASGIGVGTTNVHFIFLFSIFAGMFTSTVEEYVYNKVRSVLSLNSKEAEDYNDGIKKSDLFELGIENEDLIYRLYYDANIETIESLAKADVEDVFKKLESRYSKGEIQYYVDFAKASLDNKKFDESKPDVTVPENKKTDESKPEDTVPVPETKKTDESKPEVTGSIGET